MHQTHTKNPIHLVHREEGIEYTFTGFDQLVKYWPYIRRRDIGANFKIEYEPGEWLREYLKLRRGHEFPARSHEYILRDSFGDNIDPKIVYDAYHEKNPRYHYRPRWIPGAKRTWHRGANLRLLHTTPERRWAHAWDDEDDAPKCRASRNAKNLPNSWDDYWRYNQKSWKKFRKTQWKNAA